MDLSMIDTTYIDFIENVHSIIPYENIAIICLKPTKVTFNNGRLHNTRSPSIEYKDGYGVYSLNGIRFEKGLWEKVVSKKMSVEDVLKIKDIDQRTQALKYIDVDKFLKIQKAELIDKHEKFDVNTNIIKYELYKIPQGIFRIDAYFVKYNCPSTDNKYLMGIDPKVPHTVKDSMAWKFQCLPEEWLSQIPLVHES